VVTATNIAMVHIQVEYNSAATAFVVPNTWYSIFTGYVERWPQSWAMNGQFGSVNPTAVDAFGYLSQQKLLSSFYEEVLALNPTFFYPLDEDAPAQPSIAPLFYDLTSSQVPATIANGSVAPVADMTPGTSLTATGGYLPQGIGGPTLAMPHITTELSTQSLDLTAGGARTPGPATAAWTRVIAFRTPTYSHLANTGANLWFTGNAFLASSTFIQVSANYDASGNWGNGNGNGLLVSIFQAGVNTAAAEVNASQNNNMSDGGWHFLVFGMSGGSFSAWFDGAAMVTAAAGLSTLALPPGSGDDIGGAAKWGLSGPDGQVACVAEFPFLLNSTQALALYSAFRYGGSGLGAATSASRYQDILRWGSWIGAQAVDNFTTGETVAYGPATEMNAQASSSGTDVVSMLQSVVDTDAGFHYVAVDGTITFKARKSRYNQATPVVTFGENTAGGEVPYTTINTGYDPTRIANDISTVQTQTSATTRALDPTSASAYGDIQLQRTVNTLNPYEQSDAANYLLLRNSQPVQRIEGISVDVGANPSVWAATLALELGTRVRVMRRPPLGAATIQVDGFVEQINWTFDDKGHASVDLQISVNNQQQYWQLDSSTFSVLGTTSIIGY
jgi:hypothetical protein